MAAGAQFKAMASRELTVPEFERLKRDRATTERGFWPKLRRHARRLPFLDELLAAYYCAIDPATPLRAKAILYGAIAYFVLPVDLIPDWVVGIGFTDDAAVLAAAVRSILPHIKDHHRTRAHRAIERLAGEQAPP
jgi:uncharacterized membrane protein YkvA (DUF1232 family)